MALISEEELSGIYDFAVQLSKDAGRLLLDGAESRMGADGKPSLDTVEKDSSVDVVTQIDEGELSSRVYEAFLVDARLTRPDVEAFVKNSILSKYPAHR